MADIEKKGYLLYVSPEKTSQKDRSKKYFNFKFQGEKKVERGVCFETANRELFKEKEEKGVGVALTCKRPKCDSEDIFVSKRLCLPEVRLDFPKIKEELVFETVLEIMRDSSEKRKVNVVAKIVDCVSAEKLVPTRKKTDARQVIFTVADSTASIKLTAWEEAIDSLKVGGTYSFKNIFAKIFMNERNLSTTTDTEIELVEEEITETLENHFPKGGLSLPGAPGCSQVSPSLNPSLHFPMDNFAATGSIFSIKIDEHYVCGRCQGRNELSSNLEHLKCRECKTTFRNDNFRKRLISCCTLDQNKTEFKLDKFIINKLKEKFPKSKDLETSLIEYRGNVTLVCDTFNDEYLVSNIIFNDDCVASNDLFND